MSEVCCICGKDVYHGSVWNGWTDKTYCYACAKDHLHDGEPKIVEGQMLLDVEYE